LENGINPGKNEETSQALLLPEELTLNIGKERRIFQNASQNISVMLPRKLMWEK